ncbi:protein unc-79 homolog [Glandiceps talaboti]
MSTKSEQFSAKIRTLHDYQNRLLHNINPVPTGRDIGNTLKYFSHTLIGILKDAPEPTEEQKISKRRNRINIRLENFPNLDYPGLYGALVNLVDIVPSVQYGQIDLGQAILQSFACVVAFLEPDVLDTLPYTVATTLPVFPSSISKDIVDLMCKTFLPLTLYDSKLYDEPNYAVMSSSAILMMILQHTSNKAYQAQLVECLLTYKENVCKDLLCVIAYGPQSARKPAVQLLFHYWPSLIPPLTEVRDFKYIAWNPILCQMTNCRNPVNNAATMMSMDPSVAAQYSEHPPPLYLCNDCSDYLQRETDKPMRAVLFAQDHVSKVCENKNCTSVDKLAVVTCYGSECTIHNRNKAVRYCQNCFQNVHQHPENKEHIIQGLPPDPWNCPLEEQSYMVESVVSLLKEAQPIDKKRHYEMGVTSPSQYSSHTGNPHVQHTMNNEELDSQDESGEGLRILSRYGVWMLVEKCTPTEKTPMEVFGRMLSMLFQWFVATALQPDDRGVDLEQLKPEYLANWLIGLSHSHFDVFVSCLLPHPPEYAKVGGHWETLSSTVVQLEEGINRIFALTPYNIISFEVWDYIMPHWMEAIHSDLTEEELPKLQKTLQWLLTFNLGPLPFTAEKMFAFVVRKFEDTSPEEQEQGLVWMQILSQLDVVVPLPLVLSMFSKGVLSMSTHYSYTGRSTLGSLNDGFGSQYRKHQPESLKLSGNELKITCFVMMLDLILKQAELQELPFHQGMEDSLSREIIPLLTQMIGVDWNEDHHCSQEAHIECTLCEMSALWYQLVLDLITYIAPRDEIKISELNEINEKKLEQSISEALNKGYKHKKKTSRNLTVKMKAKQEKPKFVPSVDDLLNMESDIGAELVAPSMLSASPLNSKNVSSSDSLTTTGNHSQQQLTDKGTTQSSTDDTDTVHDTSTDSEDSWPTSHGSFKFRVNEFPKSMQLLHSFLKELSKYDDPDILLYIVSCIKVLCLNAECLHTAARDHIGYLIWLQENLLIPNLWKLLHADISHVAQILVPLILHCMALPAAVDVFWELVDKEFNDGNWHTRFNSVEKVTVLARFVEKKMFANNALIMSSLAHAFCYLINAVDDICPSVSAKAVLMLESIRRKSLKALVSCLEFQWDSVIDDRPLILHHISLLHHHVPEIHALSWEFFMNRLDTLSLEAQVDLEQNKEFPFPVDMTRSNAGLMDRSEAFMRKLNRARFARSRSESIRSLSSSFTARPGSPNKQNYRRTISMPTNVSANINKRMPHQSDSLSREKSTYSRQISAPVMHMAGLTDMMFSDGHLKTLEEEQWFPEVPPEIDLSSLDKETVHQLIFLLMKFMTKTDIENSQDERFAGKAMTTVLRHVMVLLGYNQYEKAFTLSPHHLRQSAAFYAVIAGLPKVLDRNVKLGTQLMLLALDLLKYCPSPQKSPHDFQPVDYTLWYLDPHCRHSWMLTLLVILYKYRFDVPTVNKQVRDLVRIAINTIDAQVHRCKPKKPEPPQAEDIWGATSPALPSQKTDIIEEEGSTVESDSSPSHSPTSPLLEAETPMMGQQELSNISGNIPTTSTPKESVTSRKDDSGGIFSKIFNKSKDDPRSKSLSSSWSVGDLRKQGAGKIAKSISYSALSGDAKVSCLQHDDAKKLHRSASVVNAKHHCHGLPGSPVIREEDEEDEDENDESESPRPEQPLLMNNDDPTPLVSIDDLTRDLLQATHLANNSADFMVGGEDSSGSDINQTDTPPQDITITQLQESTPLPSDSMDEKKTPESARTSESESEHPKIHPKFRAKKVRKIGVSSEIARKLALGGERQHSKLSMSKKWASYKDGEKGRKNGGDKKSRRHRRSKRRTSKSKAKRSSVFSAVRRFHEDRNAVVANRCSECGSAIEEYDEDTISLAIVVLSTFTRRDPAQAAPLLMEMFQVVGRIASSTIYPWQTDSLVNTPASSITVARQFLRCTLHQLVPMSVFPQLFQSRIEDPFFLKTVAASLTDFNDLSPTAPISYLLEGLNSKKTIPCPQVLHIVKNLADYIECVPAETAAVWANVLPSFESFFRKLLVSLPDHCDVTSTFRIIVSLLKTPVSKTLQALLDPFSKVLSHSIQKCRCKLQQLLDICMTCHRTFTRERDKLYLTRAVVMELCGALKFKTSLPDANMLILVQMVLLDAGGKLSESNMVEEEIGDYDMKSLGPTGAADCMKQSLNDALEFIGDLHTLTKVKNNMRGGSQNLNEDTLGSHLKAGIAQFIALEFTYANQRDTRGINRYLPWLYHPPTAMQQGPKEFIDCIAHIRLLSWLLLGSLMHSAMFENAIDNPGVTCHPIPLEAGVHIADHMLVILTGFAEQSKASVLHMSSLFHAFILCQLWTMYCEQAASSNPIHSDLHCMASLTIMDFWGRVTPGLLQLLSHSKVLAEMVNLHFLGLMEALQECNSSVLSKLFPLWTPILYTYHSQLPDIMHVRLQTVENYQPADPTKCEVMSYRSQMMLKWLKRLQFKLGQIEIQSSYATQLYTV